MIQLYRLAARKLTRESEMPEWDLRKMVAHHNLYNNIKDHIAQEDARGREPSRTVCYYPSSAYGKYSIYDWTEVGWVLRCIVGVDARQVQSSFHEVLDSEEEDSSDGDSSSNYSSEGDAEEAKGTNCRDTACKALQDGQSKSDLAPEEDEWYECQTRVEVVEIGQSISLPTA